MALMQSVAVLGSTGSVGTSTLDVIARHPERYRLHALSANTRIDQLFEQCCQFKPELAVMTDENAAIKLEQRLKHKGVPTRVQHGVDALEARKATFAGEQGVAGDERRVTHGCCSSQWRACHASR